jgi:hypothetical protein
MGLYSDLTDDELDAEIAVFRQARRDVIVPGNGGVGRVSRITDGDRTLEYTAANLDALERELQALISEKARRNSQWGSGRAIGVEFY